MRRDRVQARGVQRRAHPDAAALMEPGELDLPDAGRGQRRERAFEILGELLAQRVQLDGQTHCDAGYPYEASVSGRERPQTAQQ